jgi:leader peptidase (prepilin peptidase) / N-methyltransferase
MVGIGIMDEDMMIAAAAVFGAIIGSFLNVCIHRLPKKTSLIWPGSHCPRCSTAIAWYDNIPLLSYTWLRGRCRACNAPISWRYPVVEFLNAAGYGLIVWRFGLSAATLAYLLLWSALIVVSVIDLDYMIIPDRITLPGIVVGLLAGTILLPRWWDSLLGLLVGGGLLYFIAWISPYLFGKEGMGGGDIKLLAMIGAFLGWKSAILTILLGAAIGALVGIILIGVRVVSKEAYLPFGPFLSLGAGVVIFFGREIMDWYGTLLAGG